MANRNQRQKIKRNLKEVQLDSLEKTSAYFAELAIFYSGESESANQLALQCSIIHETIEQIIISIREHILPKV